MWYGQSVFHQEIQRFLVWYTPAFPLPQSLSLSSGIQPLVAEGKHSIRRRCVQIKFCYKPYSINALEYALSNWNHPSGHQKTHKFKGNITLSTDINHLYKTLWEKACLRDATSPHLRDLLPLNGNTHSSVGYWVSEVQQHLKNKFLPYIWSVRDLGHFINWNNNNNYSFFLPIDLL